MMTSLAQDRTKQQMLQLRSKLKFGRIDISLFFSFLFFSSALQRLMCKIRRHIQCYYTVGYIQVSSAAINHKTAKRAATLKSSAQRSILQYNSPVLYSSTRSTDPCLCPYLSKYFTSSVSRKNFFRIECNYWAMCH